jgi:hypothetical protein
LEGLPERKIPLEINWRRCKGIKIDFQETGCRLRTGFNWLSIGPPVADSCEHGNESLRSVKGGKFLEQMSDYQLLFSFELLYFVKLHGKAHLGGK